MKDANSTAQTLISICDARAIPLVLGGTMDGKLLNIRRVIPNSVLRLATCLIKAYIIISLNVGDNLSTAL
jgi:hypothetical protein